MTQTPSIEFLEGISAYLSIAYPLPKWLATKDSLIFDPHRK